MTEDQVVHVTAIIQDFKDKCFKKYEIGAAEHGSNVWDMNVLRLLEEGMSEAIDQYVYLYTAKEHELNRLRRIDEQQRKASQPDEPQQ